MLEGGKYIKQTPLLPGLKQMPRGDTCVALLTHTTCVTTVIPLIAARRCAPPSPGKLLASVLSAPRFGPWLWRWVFRLFISLKLFPTGRKQWALKLQDGNILEKKTRWLFFRHQFQHFSVKLCLVLILYIFYNLGLILNASENPRVHSGNVIFEANANVTLLLPRPLFLPFAD